MRALHRLHIPTLLFLNKTDRPGADPELVFFDVLERLTPAAVWAGESHANPAEVRDGLAHPVYAGSALTGEGVVALTTAIVGLLPSSEGDGDGALAGTVFKIERAQGGEKVAYVRLRSGTLRVRAALPTGKVTALTVFDEGDAVRRPSASAGEVVKVWGLAAVQVGDDIGSGEPVRTTAQFAPPTLESVVVPRAGQDGARLRLALTQLAEQDPLIDVRQDDELSISLYGEVQKEVIEATLVRDYGLEVGFHETTPIYLERPLGVGEAVEILKAETNPYLATIGLRIEPAPPDSGIRFVVDVDHSVIPLYLYKTHESFAQHMEEYVRDTLQHGLYGWHVTDCVVTLAQCLYSVPDGPPSRSGPLSTAADFRKLTPIVLRQALAAAGSAVCEPVVRARVEVPPDALGPVLAALARLEAAVDSPALEGSTAVIDALLFAARADELQRRLAGLTRGEGVLESAFAGYLPVTGRPPTRSRSS
jgi:ribosomal protection tetracycline resistance protein